MLQSCNADDRNHILCNEMSEWGLPYPDVSLPRPGTSI